MTSAEPSVPTFDPSLAEPGGWSLWRLLAAFAVVLALLSACLTFVLQSFENLRFEELEAQVFKFGLHPVDAKPVGDGRVILDRLFRDLRPVFPGAGN